MIHKNIELIPVFFITRSTSDFYLSPKFFVFKVLTVNGARVLDDVISASSTAFDDNPSFDDSANEPVQQRRDMVLSPSGIGDGENQQNIITAIAHAIDRVLFPLPVGDVLATMRADRQRRYSVFLRAVDEFCSPSVRTLLTGTFVITSHDIILRGTNYIS